MPNINRRDLVKTGLILAGAAGLNTIPSYAKTPEVQNTPEVHGLSAFGDLELAPDFQHFSYVNSNAPKGGLLSLQIKNTSGNQGFDTFNSFNIFILKGDGAAGVDSTFDTLMAGNADEADAVYGLVARAVRVSDDKLTYHFTLRPEARFHDGSKITAKDVAFSLDILKTKGHPIYQSLLRDMLRASAESDLVVKIEFAPERSRNAHLNVAIMPIFSKTFYSTREFDAVSLDMPLGSGPYKLANFEQGKFVEYARVKDYWAKDLPVSKGQNNFDRLRYSYFADRSLAFERFKDQTFNFQEEYTSRIWTTGYDFPAFKAGKVTKEALPKREPTASQGWYFNTRREQFNDKRIREALGFAFDFEWTRANIMYGNYSRMTSYFENSPLKAQGEPSSQELALLEPFRSSLPESVFAAPILPPVSDGSGSDRILLRKAAELLKEAGCTRAAYGALLLPSGKPFEIEFLDFQPSFQPHTQPLQQNLKKLGIEAKTRIVDAAQYKQRTEKFDFDIVSMALGGSLTPGDSMRIVYGSKAASIPGSRNMAGINHPAIDAMIERIVNAKTRPELIFAARALDRILLSQHYWIPMWYNDKTWLAYWDMFSRPAQQPKLSSGAPSTWWFDSEKANRIGVVL
jgi:microcin C transport system substrate-binding protein